jgi:hypothetical protein
MAEIEYFHICDSAFMAEGGKHCIIGIFDNINANAFPATHPTLTLAIRLRGHAHEVVPLKIELARPNGEALGAPVQASVTVDAGGSAFINMNVVGTQFPEPGRYTFTISSGGRTLASHSLALQKMPSFQPGAPQGTPQKFH